MTEGKQVERENHFEYAAKYAGVTFDQAAAVAAALTHKGWHIPASTPEAAALSDDLTSDLAFELNRLVSKYGFTDGGEKKDWAEYQDARKVLRRYEQTTGKRASRLSAPPSGEQGQKVCVQCGTHLSGAWITNRRLPFCSIKCDKKHLRENGEAAAHSEDRATQLLRDVMEASRGYNCQGDCGTCEACKAHDAAYQFLNPSGEQGQPVCIHCKTCEQAHCPKTKQCPNQLECEEAYQTFQVGGRSVELFGAIFRRPAALSDEEEKNA